MATIPKVKKRYKARDLHAGHVPRSIELWSAEQRLLEAMADYQHVVARVQKHCRHPIKFIAECSYKDDTTGESNTPMRVCNHCGMIEDGWGSGYQVLAPGRVQLPNRVSRARVIGLGRGLHITEDMKGGLIRKFCTVRDLIHEHWLKNPPEL